MNVFEQEYIGYVVVNYCYRFMKEFADVFFLFPNTNTNKLEVQALAEEMLHEYDYQGIHEVNRRIEFHTIPLRLNDVIEEYQNFEMGELFIIPPTVLENKSPIDIYHIMVAEAGVPFTISSIQIGV